MKYSEFREKVQDYPFFRSNLFPLLTDKPQLLREQLTDWLKKGYVIKLKRGMYTLRKDDRRTGLSEYVLANNLYTPSYISLELALSHYGFIPEQVYRYTSISTKKTAEFHNDFGVFSYQHVKPKAFTGYIAEQDEYRNTYYIATPEKALVDFLYFKMSAFQNDDVTIFSEGYRLQGLEELNVNELRRYAKLFAVNKLQRITELLIQFKESEYD